MFSSETYTVLFQIIFSTKVSYIHNKIFFTKEGEQLHSHKIYKEIHTFLLYDLQIYASILKIQNVIYDISKH
jgi:hypothetical protein